MRRWAALALLATALFSTKSGADHRGDEWPSDIPATESVVTLMDDQVIRAYVKGALDMAYIALVQMSFNASAQTPESADEVASRYAVCFAPLANIEPQEWLARSRQSGLPVVEAMIDAAIAACTAGTNGLPRTDDVP